MSPGPLQTNINILFPNWTFFVEVNRNTYRINTCPMFISQINNIQNSLNDFLSNKTWRNWMAAKHQIICETSERWREMVSDSVWDADQTSCKRGSFKAKLRPSLWWTPPVQAEADIHFNIIYNLEININDQNLFVQLRLWGKFPRVKTGTSWLQGLESWSLKPECINTEICCSIRFMKL